MFTMGTQHLYLCEHHFHHGTELLMELSSIGPALGRLGSDSSMGEGGGEFKSKHVGLSPPTPHPFTLTTGLERSLLFTVF